MHNQSCSFQAPAEFAELAATNLGADTDRDEEEEDEGSEGDAEAYAQAVAWADTYVDEVPCLKFCMSLCV